MSLFKWSLLTLNIVSGGLFAGGCLLSESQEARLRAEAKKALAIMYATGGIDTPCGHSRLNGGYGSDSEESKSPLSTSPQQGAGNLTMSQIFPSQQK